MSTTTLIDSYHGTTAAAQYAEREARVEQRFGVCRRHMTHHPVGTVLEHSVDLPEPVMIFLPVPYSTGMAHHSTFHIFGGRLFFYTVDMGYSYSGDH